jgi:hypothetical protein
MEQRDAAGADPKARGGNAAAPAAQGRQAAAAAPTAQPDRLAHARRPAPALLTTHRTNRQPCQADRIPATVPGADRAQGGPRAGPKEALGMGAASRSHGTGWLVLLQRRCRALPADPNSARACCFRPAEGRYQDRQSTRRSNLSGP